MAQSGLLAPLPVGTRLVHIGPPKTGTTALQGAFHARRAETLAQGVRYAGHGRHAGSAVLAVTERPSFSADHGSPSIRRWKAFARETRTAGELRVLASSEFFADALPVYIPRIVADLGGARVHILVTVRPLVRILPSQWQQYVQSGMRMDFEPWLDKMLNHPPAVEAETFWRRHRHDLLVARWAEAVGPDRVTVIVVDESDHDRLYRQVEALLGLVSGTLVGQPDLANRSMTMPEVQAIRAFNIAYHDKGLGNAMMQKVMHFGAACYMKEIEPDPGWARIETPEWAADRAVALGAEMATGITATGVRVIGDVDSLGKMPAGARPSGVPRDRAIPAEVAGRMAMGVLIASGMARDDGRGHLTAMSGGSTHFESPEVARLSTRHLAAVIVLRGRDWIRRRGRRLLRRATS